MKTRNRPFGVTIIALLLVFNGLLAAARGGLQIYEFIEEQQGIILRQEIIDFTGTWTLLDWLTLPVAIAGLVMAWGMWRMQPRAWFWTMFLNGLYLVAHLIDYINGHASYIQLLITLATVFYLNQRDVHLVFHVDYEEEQYSREPRQEGRL